MARLADAEMYVVHRTKNPALVEIELGMKPFLSRGFYEARKDLGNPNAWVIYSGTERYPLSSGTEAIGLDQFLTEVLLGL